MLFRFVPELQSAVLHFWKIGYEFSILRCLLSKPRGFGLLIWSTSKLPKTGKLHRTVDTRTLPLHWLGMTLDWLGQVAAALVAIQEAAAGANVSSYHDRGGRRWHSWIKHHESVWAGFTKRPQTLVLLPRWYCKRFLATLFRNHKYQPRAALGLSQLHNPLNFKLWNQLHSLLHSSTVSFSLGCIFTLTPSTLPCCSAFLLWEVGCGCYGLAAKKPCMLHGHCIHRCKLQYGVHLPWWPARL